MPEQARMLIDELMSENPDDPRLQALAQLMSDPGYMTQGAAPTAMPTTMPTSMSTEDELSMVQDQMNGGSWEGTDGIPTEGDLAKVAANPDLVESFIDFFGEDALPEELTNPDDEP